MDGRFSSFLRFPGKAFGHSERANKQYQSKKASSSIHICDSFRRYGYIYIHVPKSGGISVSSRLMGFAVGHKSISYYYRHEPLFAQKAFKFSLVRNPYHRFKSAYYYLVNGGMNAKDARFGQMILESFPTFWSFCDGIGSDKFMSIYSICEHLHPQWSFLTVGDKPINIAMTYVGRLENLDEFWKVVGSQIPLIPIKDPGVMNRSSYAMPSSSGNFSLESNIAESALPNALVRQVCDFYERDMCLFSYEVPLS